MKKLLVVLIAFGLVGCEEKKQKTVTSQIKEAPFVWEGATIYFLLTDRFQNGDTSNDVNFNRNEPAGTLRGFEGGDIKGVIQKIEEGYFTKLGINAIWMTPVVEQIHGGTNEGTGLTYAFHGYWIKDWTALDPNFGTLGDLEKLVQVAHAKGIRILLDAVVNHTGPVTDEDPVWPEDWVRTGPQCTYDNYEHTVSCTLVKNLPDVLTDSNDNVELPPQLVEKWKAEGRYDEEIAELNAFFERTGYPRAPRFYIIKWLTDYITEFGIDGYRVDTVKHTEPYVWQEFRTECDYAFDQWKQAHPDKVLDTNGFYLVGEVYNYGISGGQQFDFGDKKVNYFDKAFNSLINFESKWSAMQLSYEDMFSKYSNILQGDLKNYGVLNYMSSHDDGQPFDQMRQKPYEAANRLLLCPGTSQVYYGDESSRPLLVEGTVGDANLRSLMNWEDIETNPDTKKILDYWQKLGSFRKKHPAVGAGVHQMILNEPYVFSRSYKTENYSDTVVIGLPNQTGIEIKLDVSDIFGKEALLHDAFSNSDYEVKEGRVTIITNHSIFLLERIN